MNHEDWVLTLLVLIAVMVFAILTKVNPEAANNMYAMLLLVGAFFVVRGSYRAIRGIPERRAKRKQEAADDKEYWEYRAAHDAIRDKYQGSGQWNEATRPPREYEQEIRALNIKHTPMLMRRNGYEANWYDEKD